jgi:hypothetical protein
VTKRSTRSSLTSMLNATKTPAGRSRSRIDVPPGHGRPEQSSPARPPGSPCHQACLGAAGAAVHLQHHVGGLSTELPTEERTRTCGRSMTLPPNLVVLPDAFAARRYGQIRADLERRGPLRRPGPAHRIDRARHDLTV